MSIRPLGVLLVVLAALPASGQVLHVDAISRTMSNRDIAGPLTGMFVSLDRLRLGRASLRIGGEYSGSTSRQPGVAECGPDISIGTGCAFGTREERARLLLGTAGVEIRATEAHAELSVFADFGIGTMGFADSSAGYKSEQPVQRIWSAMASAALGWRFNERWGLRAEGGLGSFAPRGAAASPNAYPSLSRGIHTGRLSIGAFWAGRRPE